MQDRDQLIARLRETGDRIERWRSDARRIRGLANQALDTREVQAERLQEVEETAGEIYREIAAFDALVAEVADTSTVAAGELAEVADALHLVLLEITELSTTMYSVRSREQKSEASSESADEAPAAVATGAPEPEMDSKP